MSKQIETFMRAVRDSRTGNSELHREFNVRSRNINIDGEHVTVGKKISSQDVVDVSQIMIDQLSKCDPPLILSLSDLEVNVDWIDVSLSYAEPMSIERTAPEQFQGQGTTNLLD